MPVFGNRSDSREFLEFLGLKTLVGICIRLWGGSNRKFGVRRVEIGQSSWVLTNICGRFSLDKHGFDHKLGIQGYARTIRQETLISTQARINKNMER